MLQALWRTVRNPNPVLATTAFRVLGKFGGANRKMLKEPQELVYKQDTLANETDGNSSTCYPKVVFRFKDANDSSKLPIDYFVDLALDCICGKSEDEFYQKESFEVLKMILQYNIKQTLQDQDKVEVLHSEIMKKYGSENKTDVSQNVKGFNTSRAPRFAKSESRVLLENCLVGVFSACSVKVLKKEADAFVKDLINALMLISTAQGKIFIIHF